MDFAGTEFYFTGFFSTRPLTIEGLFDKKTCCSIDNQVKFFRFELQMKIIVKLISTCFSYYVFIP